MQSCVYIFSSIPFFLFLVAAHSVVVAPVIFFLLFRPAFFYDDILKYFAIYDEVREEARVCLAAAARAYTYRFRKIETLFEYYFCIRKIVESLGFRRE